MKKSISALLISSLLVVGSLPAQAQAEPIEAATTAQDFVNRLAGSQFGAAAQTFDTGSTDGVTSGSLRQTWQDIVAESGPLVQQVAVTTEPFDEATGSYLVVITGQFEQGNRDLFVIVNSDNEIIGLDAVENQ